MKFSAMDILFWAAGFVGHVALLLVLLLRGRTRTFPMFTAMIVYQALVSASLFLASRYLGPGTYRSMYWGTAIGDYVFQLGLIYEIAIHVLRPTGSWVSDARRSFLLWSALGLILAAIAVRAVEPPTAKSALSLLEARSMLFTSLLTCELFLAMIASANRLGLQWRSHVMALGQGLTAWAVAALVSDTAHLALGWGRNFVVLDYGRMVTYLGALVFWTVSFWLPERERAPLSPEMQNYLVALHRRVQYDLDRLTEPRRPSL